VDSPQAVLRLPHFYWPAFSSTVGRLSPDPATGLMLLSLPQGPVAGRIELETTWAERLGEAASLAGLALWFGGLAWLVAARRRRALEGAPLPQAKG
ncbi:MAG TPA: hypothetical protein VE684_09390, partial [Crenalkalicoccus sp.]|nr:hypothetical protein [Crenalkalicoccus sp.]